MASSGTGTFAGSWATKPEKKDPELEVHLKELIGNFKNPGRTWQQQPEVVNVHDFPQEAVGRAVPYGIYNLNHNRGYVYVGKSADTPELAVEAIA